MSIITEKKLFLFPVGFLGMAGLFFRPLDIRFGVSLEKSKTGIFLKINVPFFEFEYTRVVIAPEMQKVMDDLEKLFGGALNPPVGPKSDFPDKRDLN